MKRRQRQLTRADKRQKAKDLSMFHGDGYRAEGWVKQFPLRSERFRGGRRYPVDARATPNRRPIIGGVQGQTDLNLLE